MSSSDDRMAGTQGPQEPQGQDWEGAEDISLDIPDSPAPLPPCEYITGPAGSGKTFLIRERIANDPSYGLLCATTGIAAINLGGATTLHSALGLHPDSIDDAFTSGAITRRMHRIAQSHRRLIIDEVSMLSGRLLDILYECAKQVNEYVDMRDRPFGITLVGDFLQLPPINEPWAFEADCWSRFADGTTRLTKNWRQGEGAFLDALNCLRRGAGVEGARLLKSAGVRFVRALDPGEDSTVILGRNQDVDNFNLTRLLKLPGASFTYRSDRWGWESGGWGNIPPELRLREGAYVMVLANDTEKDPLTGRSMFRWVNGDCGTVVANEGFGVRVRLKRTEEEIVIGRITRETTQKSEPDEYGEDLIENAVKMGQEGRLPDGSWWDSERKRWVRGGITYLPIRLAYATTVHKSQGLTLDAIQMDIRHAFMGKPGMLYVAASRTRTAGGLVIVGDEAMVGRRCQVEDRVREWL